MNTTGHPPDLARVFCDLIMKGGITSGVVYPRAVAGLAKRYRFRNIGGASVGAIAAGAAAAAEYARQKHGTDAGFRRLEGLAEELAKPPTTDPNGPSLLFQLFAPTRLSRPLFDALARTLNRKTWKARVALALGELIRGFPETFALGIAALLVISLPTAAVLAPAFRAALAQPGRSLAVTLFVLCSAPAFLAMVAAVAVVVIGAATRRALHHLALVMSRQDFGLCTGCRESPDGTPALTDWLHDLLQALANERGPRPLTFGDLRRLRFAETPKDNGIVLRVVTTCLTQGRPYSLPLQERFYFDPVELGRYFPAEVVEWMKTQSWRRSTREEESADALARQHTVTGAARPLYPIPEPDDFPVLVAVRMSLSFPILVSAIPLYRYGVHKDGEAWVPDMQRLVFTDGGVCSNLPIHLFDAPLPVWPTFALNLRDDLPPGSPDEKRVVPPRRGRSYQGDRYEISSEPTLGAVASFLVAIVNTMQNWRDMLQRAAPGARERVFTVRHTEEEGGLNLNMESKAMRKMSESGARAADAITDAFLPAAGTQPADSDWEHHRWVRLRLLLPALRDFLGEAASAMCASVAGPSFQELLGTPPPMGRSHEISQATRAAAWTFLDELEKASLHLEHAKPDLERTEPRPVGELRVTPTF